MSKNSDPKGSPGSDSTILQRANRKRKSHRKSRLGCVNCKLRSVKCDEVKPECGRCLDSGYSCTYSADSKEIQLSYVGVLKLDVHCLSNLTFLHQFMPVASPIPGHVSTHHMKSYEKAAVKRYITRTDLTFRHESMKNDASVLDIANSHPFLYHIYTALALLHDIYLSDDPMATWQAQSTTISYHTYHATALFHQKLALHNAKPHTQIADTERDALWTCSSLLSVVSFASMDSLDPLGAWPLKPGTASDLAWIKLDQGKNIVWKMADLSRPESQFHDFYQTIMQVNLPSGASAIRPHALPAGFYDYFELGPNSTRENNPYFSPATVLSQLLPDDNTFKSGLRLSAFPSEMHSSYIELLEAKDARAMLLLVYWYEKLIEFDWWFFNMRTRVEGIAMCIYLRQHHSDDQMLMALLKKPSATIMDAYANGYRSPANSPSASVKVEPVDT